MIQIYIRNVGVEFSFLHCLLEHRSGRQTFHPSASCLVFNTMYSEDVECTSPTSRCSAQCLSCPGTDFWVIVITYSPYLPWLELSLSTSLETAFLNCSSSSWYSAWLSQSQSITSWQFPQRRLLKFCKVNDSPLRKSDCSWHQERNLW